MQQNPPGQSSLWVKKTGGFFLYGGFMKYCMIATIALATLTFGVAAASFAENESAGSGINNFSIRVNCRTIKTSYHYAEVYRANKAAHPEWSEKQLQLATEKTLSLLIAAMDICDGKTQVRRGMVSGDISIVK
ncbi:MAG: hypothetical protein HQL09_05850 [Nitrospirae bacterium]|nr:hypothetical protein [Nitrospirota bacterium]